MGKAPLKTNMPHLVLAACGHHVPENELREQLHTKMILCRDCDENVQRHYLRESAMRESPVDSGATRTSQVRT